MNEDTLDILMLPDALVAHVLEYVPFSNRRCYFLCSSELWTFRRGGYEALLQELKTPREPPYSVLWTLTNLTTLHVGKWATDLLLQELQHERAVPRLVHLSMVRSMKITNTGLEYLTKSPRKCQTLETIDITFCRNTTYPGTLVLRDKLINLKLIRRQPEWLDGLYETPFENDNLHTYWADGTFTFQREALSSGYVCDYFEWSDGRVGTKVQYNDFSALDGIMPEEVRSYYRPGVSILKLPGENAILVAQIQRGMYPPKDYPVFAQKDICPVGESIYLNENGNVLDNNEENHLRYVMISYIPMRPVKSPMPPSELVEKNRTILGDNAEPIFGQELSLHAMLGGRIEEFEAIQEHYRGVLIDR